MGKAKKEGLLHFLIDLIIVILFSVATFILYPVLNFLQYGGELDFTFSLWFSIGCFVVGLIIILVKHLKKSPFKKFYHAEGSLSAELIGCKCHACRSRLEIKKASKLVDRYSDEGRYYEFGTHYYNEFSRTHSYKEDYHKGQVVSECEFVHNAYYCKKCDCFIEFVTQHSLEKIDKHFIKKCREREGLSYKKRFLDKDGNVLSFPKDIEGISSLEITMLCDNKELNKYIFLVKRLDKNERAPYFDYSSAFLNKL